MRRIYQPVPVAGTETTLDAERDHYVRRVLRLENGADVELADGTGRLFVAQLDLDATPGRLTSLELIGEGDEQSPLAVVTALTKQSRWEWGIEKASELGATHVLPWAASRSVVQVSDAKLSKKLDRWTKIVEGAARQCERLIAPEVEEPRKLAELVARLDGFQLVLCDETEGEARWPALDWNGPVALVLGPEGGITDEERARWQAAGARTVGLGRHILRAETAICVALSAVRFHRDELL